jgi:Secretion system C-terminal sorting domain
MRTGILLPLLLVGCVSILSAQQKSRAFAVTGNNGLLLWENISEVDLDRAQSKVLLYNKTNSPFSLLNAETRKPVEATLMVVNGKTVSTKAEPTATMVAAAAYDEKHGKLFFTPMRINELRWVDLNDRSGTVKVYTFKNSPLINANVEEVPNQITRMCMGADGYGYAMSNNAMHLIRFSTGKNISITDLGSVVSEKNTLTINNSCGGWGGDMVADTKGNLYVISANHNIFKVNIETRVASFVTRLKDIPDTYTTNGAAVDDEGNLIIGSANSTEAFFKVNPSDWSVTKMDNGGEKLNVSDLASSNFLFDTRTKKQVTAISDFREVYSEKISAYPNPVSEGIVKVNFEKQPKGNYSIQLMDQVGRVLLTKQISVGGDNQLESININQNVAQGFYLLRVMNSNKKVVLAKKLMIE